jgi:hypothetical protein
MYRFVLCILIIGTFSVPGVAQVQPGSIGGTIGKKDKSISSGDDQAAPPRQRSNGPARPRNGDKKISSDDKAGGSQKVFVNPTLNGTRIDWYSGESGGWGRPAADAWCRSKDSRIRRLSPGNITRQSSES